MDQKYLSLVIRLYQNQYNKSLKATNKQRWPACHLVFTVGQINHCQSRSQLHLSTNAVCLLQNSADFSLVKSETGEIVAEDGRSRCPFNPEYKSTAIMAGRSEWGCQLSIKSSLVWMFWFIEATAGIGEDTWWCTGGWYQDKMGRNIWISLLCVWRRSPFPHGEHCEYTGLLRCVADGELYAGTVSNFQGNEPIIYKSLSQGTALKTENSLNWLQGTWLQAGLQWFSLYLHIAKVLYIIISHPLWRPQTVCARNASWGVQDLTPLTDCLDEKCLPAIQRLVGTGFSSQWEYGDALSRLTQLLMLHVDSFVHAAFLSDPAFVGSAYIQESLPKGNPVGNDDKIYFFFSEAGKEFDFFDNTIVSRIARVCKVSDAWKQMVNLKRPFYPWAAPHDPPPLNWWIPLVMLRTCSCTVVYAPSESFLQIKYIYTV